MLEIDGYSHHINKTFDITAQYPTMGKTTIQASSKAKAEKPMEGLQNY